LTIDRLRFVKMDQNQITISSIKMFINNCFVIIVIAIDIAAIVDINDDDATSAILLFLLLPSPSKYL
jgi:hypothetical protein